MNKFETLPSNQSNKIPSADMTPGIFVKLVGCEDWGIGQVQSSTGTHVTVNFDHKGKQTINSRYATLLIIDTPDD